MRRKLAWAGVAIMVVVVAVAIILPRLRGTEASRVVPDATGSWYDIAFTVPGGPEACKPKCLDTRLVQFIDGTSATLDIAAYDFDLVAVADAMARAAARKVRVRMVTDSDTVANVKDAQVQGALKIVRNAGIPIVEDNRRPIMHDKFAVADGTRVLTGSWNFTEGDTYRLDNHQVIIRDARIAANYAHEFEEMFTRKKFGPNKSKDVPNPIVTIDGANIETYFSSANDPSVPLIKKIGGAARTIDFLAFSFTHDRLGDVVRARASSGVKVRGVFEKTGSETKFSEFKRMREAGLDVLQDGNPGLMHHKLFVIDGTVTAFGSFNFSDNAANDNDENLLIVTDPAFARAFTAEVDRVVAVARRAAK
jgi:phosphatidylserine/phosphatidylglycerophosphate/cardiolipin synthase-like enzyme